MTRAARPRFALASALLLACGLFAPDSEAQDDAPPASIFAAAVKALTDGQPGDAIASFETLADRGIVDAVASYDRGLAYASRVRIGAEVPGDLGQAIQGFEEARELTGDEGLAEDAARALNIVRSEIARRRMRSGLPATVDSGRSLGRAIAGLLPEDAWEALSVLASVALAVGLFLRFGASRPQSRVGGGVVLGIAAPVMAVAVAMTVAARHDRWDVREAVVVTASARPLDEHGIALTGSAPLPEGARIEVISTRSPMTRVRFGPDVSWVASDAIRVLARPR